MNDSYRLTVLKRLCEHVEQTQIDPDDSSITLPTYRGRMIFGDDESLPMVSIIESTKPDTGNYAGTNGEDRSTFWPLIIQGWARNDTDNPSDPAYQLMAAVEAQLYKIIEIDNHGDPVNSQAYLLGNGGQGRTHLIASLRYGPGVVSPPREQVSSQAFFFLPVWVQLVEKMGQPYFVNA